MTKPRAVEPAMTDRPLAEPVYPGRDAPLRASAEPPTGRFAGIFHLLAPRRRARGAQPWRGFDRHQLRDLGISHLDLW
jgi:hypothetical protein